MELTCHKGLVCSFLSRQAVFGFDWADHPQVPYGAVEGQDKLSSSDVHAILKTQKEVRTNDVSKVSKEPSSQVYHCMATSAQSWISHVPKLGVRKSSVAALRGFTATTAHHCGCNEDGWVLVRARILVTTS